MLNNKSGQIAETITWVVATVIIVVTLIVFIFISVSLSEAKDLSLNNAVAKVGDFLISDEVDDISRLELKTDFAFKLKIDNKEKIIGWINGK